MSSLMLIGTQMSCSVVIDVEPSSLDDSNPDLDNDVSITAGVMAQDIGIGDQDTELAGEMTSPLDMMLNAGQETRLTVGSAHTPTAPSATYEGSPLSPSIGGAEQLDDSLGGHWVQEGGHQAGHQGGEEQVPTNPLESVLQATLPEINCIQYDITQNRCLQFLKQSDEEMCDEWEEQFQMRRIDPWSGDRSTCQSGNYASEGIEDFERVLNLYRRRAGAEEVIVRTNVVTEECALVRDILQREQLSALSDFDETVPCYAEHLLTSAQANRIISLNGFWSVYEALQAVMELTAFNSSEPIINLITLRQLMLSPAAVAVDIGARARGSCYLIHDQPLMGNEPLVQMYPPAGVNPYSMVKPANHNGLDIPWSISIHSTNVNDPVVRLSSFNTSTQVWDDVVVNLAPGTTQTGVSTGLAFRLLETPSPQTIYRLNVTWNEGGMSRSIDLYTAFKLCTGLTQPDFCQLFPDNCALRGSSCAVLSDAPSGNTRQCLWRGPLPVGSDCSGSLGTRSCREGSCIIWSESSSLCSAYCDESEDGALSCEEKCEGQSATLETGVGICIP